MASESRELLACFAETDMLSVPRISLLRNFFGSLENAWKCENPQEFLSAGFGEKATTLFFERKKAGDPKKFLASLAQCGASLLFWEDNAYPERLKNIASPPVFLFCRGTLLPEDQFSLAVVGTRRISAHGKQMTERMVSGLARAGMTIVSGLARGVDALAHRKTLQEKGRTIAVLGCGIDTIYPPEHRELAEEILASGAILSEFAPGVPPHHYHFPRRNRIVSGLSLGTLVIEGTEKSGSLITAQFALDQNREVFAVPGSPASATAFGPNRLIQKGEAKLVLTPEDILEEIALPERESHHAVQKLFPPDGVERTVYDFLSEEPTLFDDLLRKSAFSSAQFASTLTILEMKGFVIQFGGNRWAKK